MPTAVRRRSRSAARLLAAALLVLCVACNRTDRDGDREQEAGGAVAVWSPPVVDEIRGVPMAAVREAVGRRVAGARPAPLDADQWRHVRVLYRGFGEGPLWLDAKGADEERVSALLRAVVSADRDALRLDAYPLPALVRAIAAVRERRPTAEQLAEADVLLTSAYAALGEDLLTGQVSPRNVTEDWHIDPEEEAVDSALVRSLREPVLDAAIARMRPENPDYAALRKALVQYREIAARGGWPAVPTGRALKPGEPERVERLQALRARLAAEGLIAAEERENAEAAESAVPATNAIGGDSARRTERKQPARVRAPKPGEAAYDSALAGAVAAYQARHAIVVDSVLGEETVRSMNLPATYRVAQIAANLERHRWMPRSLGTRHILVNVPAFHLEAWDNGRNVLEMKVIVGEEYEDRRTAVFADTMTTVVFRPYWFVPDTIANKELWPKINADPAYMAEHDYETFEENGKTRIRQKPGPENSLGLVKFLFPNAFNIYLHDTPEDQLFEKDVRAFSHGCIRLEKPAELGAWVLGWPVDSVRRAMETPPDNKEVRVPRRLPVYITYFTAYVEDGQLRFGNDLYDRDEAMVRVMRAGAGQEPEVVQAVELLRKMVDD